MRPKSAIGLPKAWRCLAYTMAWPSAARAAHAGGAHLEAANVENVEGDMVPLAHVAQQILHRDLAVGEHQRTGGGAADTQLVLFRAYGEPGSPFSIRNAVNFSPSTLTKTVNRSAKPALLIHIFSPLRR